VNLGRRTALFGVAGTSLAIQGCSSLAQCGSVSTGIQKDLRFKHAEVEGHHDDMLIDPQGFISSLLALAWVTQRIAFVASPSDGCSEGLSS
jgi:hypothetical protein